MSINENLTSRLSRYLKYLFLLIIVLPSCTDNVPEGLTQSGEAVINPDYSSVTIPVNIAPMNFSISGDEEKYKIRVYNKNGDEILIKSSDGKVIIPAARWTKLLSLTGSGDLMTDIYAYGTEGWKRYNTITNHVVTDKVDNYLVYRLIEPGYETWNKMGIYQREVSSFRESPVMLNDFSGGNCMNCHSFRANSTDHMMFHMRGENGGTVIYDEGNLKKVDTKTDSTIAAGVYPAWHPSGNFIAFSVNNIVQSFHAVPGKKIEVYDTLSNIVLYDVKKNIISTHPGLSSSGMLETFPAWSPDGRYLYFCSALKKPMKNYNEIRYDLMRISFDPQTSAFGDVEAVLAVSDSSRSISFPRLSPDGRYLAFCMADYGNFMIWHPESDLYLLDLADGRVSEIEVNSERAESYPAWSSSGRWIVFASRRQDGLYTRPYYSYMDEKGNFSKPFVLPQGDPDFYSGFMKSFNRAEPVASEIDLDPRKLEKVVHSEALKSDFHRGR